MKCKQSANAYRSSYHATPRWGQSSSLVFPKLDAVSACPDSGQGSGVHSEGFAASGCPSSVSVGSFDSSQGVNTMNARVIHGI